MADGARLKAVKPFKTRLPWRTNAFAKCGHYLICCILLFWMKRASPRHCSGTREDSNSVVGLKRNSIYPPSLAGSPRNIEIAVFRLVQECLTNIHRHAESPDAVIRITKTGSSLAVDVSDHGRGMRSQTENESGDSYDFFGVGITGMRERVEQLGGRMEIQSGPRGTRVQATLPFQEIASCVQSGS